MSALFEALENTTETENGMPAFVGTTNACLDFFFVVGTARGQDVSEKFNAAFQEAPELALRILLWSRDVREGAGERQRFRDLLVHMVNTNVNKLFVAGVIHKIPELGRWDDLHCLVGTEYEDLAISLHARAIREGNGLAAKWAPRRGIVANRLRKALGLTTRQYIKFIVERTNVVETPICAQQWDKIEYEKVPSVASHKHAKTFLKHDEDRYSAYLQSVMKGESKMNANSIFPHDVLFSSQVPQVQREAQWKSLPDFLNGTDERILTVCDTSGSMNGLPIQICVALGLYFSERLEGKFKNCVVTFNAKPQFVRLKSSDIMRRVDEIRKLPWGMNTNLELMFETLLRTAREENIPASEMPTKLLIISDMQFDQCVSNTSHRVMNMIREKYEERSYKMPQVVFWNVANHDFGNVPIKSNENGVCLVSGASPSTIRSVLGGKLSPMQIMLDTVMKDRYAL